MNLVSLFKFYLDLESLRLLLALHNQETVILVYGGSNITKSLPREMRPSSGNHLLATTAVTLHEIRRLWVFLTKTAKGQFVSKPGSGSV